MPDSLEVDVTGQAWPQDKGVQVVSGDLGEETRQCLAVTRSPKLLVAWKKEEATL